MALCQMPSATRRGDKERGDVCLALHSALCNKYQVRHDRDRTQGLNLPPHVPDHLARALHFLHVQMHESDTRHTLTGCCALNNAVVGEP